jgi:hypothetical protein
MAEEKKKAPPVGPTTTTAAPEVKKKAPRKPVGPTTTVFAIKDTSQAKAGQTFEIEDRFLISAIQAGVVRTLTPEEKKAKK